MVKIIIKKIVTDWYLWLTIYVALQFFKIAPQWTWFSMLPHSLIFLLRCIFEGGLFMVIMYRWKFPVSWLLLYLISAILLDGFDIISITRLGFSVLFLGFYFQNVRKAEGVDC